LSVLAAGFAALSVGDSGFVYFTATGKDQTGNLIDAGWVVGFLLLAFAAALPAPEYEPRQAEVTSRAALSLPYLPAFPALVLASYRVRGSHHDNVSLLAGAFIVLVLLVRQMLILDENRHLTLAVRHQAFHDQLTGLANRALFQDRLSHSLDLHQLPPVTRCCASWRTGCVARRAPATPWPGSAPFSASFGRRRRAAPAGRRGDVYRQAPGQEPGGALPAAPDCQCAPCHARGRSCRSPLTA
jgi:hypothetical protein